MCIQMMYKFTIIKTPGKNGEKAEVGMNVEVSSKLLSTFFYMTINPLRITNNGDYEVLNKAFKDKYGVDIRYEGLLNTSISSYIKCEEL